MRRLLLCLVALSLPAAAQVGSFQQWCQAGGQFSVVSGITATTPVQASYPQCQVEVFFTGTATPASITVGSPTGPVSNPFCANADASFLFFASTSSQYDVVMSNANACNPPPLAQLPASFTFYDAQVSGSGGGGGGGTITGATANGGLVVTGTTLGLTTSGCSAGWIESFTGTAWGCSIPGGSYGVDAILASGVDPCLQIQAAIYGLPSSGGIVNATGFTSITTCSVNPFQAPAQSNPTVFTGLPSNGLLLLPPIGIPENVPFYVPNKWAVQGVPGYGPAPGRTTIQPSTTFVANRPQISAAGTGTTGCSSSGGLTVTITGTTLPSANNLLGMWVFCSSNASATAVPDSTTAQIGGVVIGVAGNVLTLNGVGASGAVANTGWVITPVIGGWAPGPQGYAVMGATIDWLTVSCQTPSATYVNPGCIGWLDVSAQENSALHNFGVLYFDYIGIGVFTFGAEDGGPFDNITLNSKGKGTNSTIGIQMGGTGFNAAGGGASGLCSPSNPCAGTSTRDWSNLTILLDGTGVGTGGTGIDVGMVNTKIGDGISHCEGAGTCVRIGYSSAAQGIEVRGMAGCSASSCANTSVVDVSANYGSVGVPGPTQNISLNRLARSFGSTFNFRDFINLTSDINDSTIGTYQIGAAGSSNTEVWTDAQPLGCITTGGSADSNGAHCAANSDIPVTSIAGGVYYALGFNANGTKDDCQQMSNAMQFANTAGLTEGVIIDATGFTQKFGNPCGISPWASGAGNYPYSGVLKLAASNLFLSQPWVVPVNWTVQGSGGNGIGIGGGTGTILSPNIGNTVNANWANDTVSGTVSTSAGSATVTGVGTNFTSANLTHTLLACATLPCTTQSTMALGIIATVNSTTSVSLTAPAQSTLSGAAYTINAPILTNAGVVRDVAVDGNSYTTGATVGVLESGNAGSYVENFSAAHVNGMGVASTSVLNSQVQLRGPIQVTANGLGVSAFMCVDAPNGIWVTESLTCETNTTSIPTLSYGVLMGGTGSLNNLYFQDVAIGLELMTPLTYVTNAVTVNGVAGGSGSTAPTTLVDLGGLTATGSSNGPSFSVALMGLQAGGSTNTLIDHFDSYTLTDPSISYYLLGRGNGGCRTLFNDSKTSGVPNAVTCNPQAIAQINQTATRSFAGSCSMVTSTTCNFLLASPPTTYLCWPAIDHASVPPATAIAATCSVVGNSVTIMAGTSNSLTWDALFVGNPN